MAPPLAKKQVKLNAHLLALMLDELLDGPCTSQAMADRTGLFILTVNKTMRAFYQEGVVHIAAWERDAADRMTVRVWGLGRGKDAKKQIKKKSQMNRESRQRRILKMAQQALSGAMQ